MKNHSDVSVATNKSKAVGGMAGLGAERVSSQVTDAQTVTVAASTANASKQACYNVTEGTCNCGERGAFRRDPKAEPSMAESDRFDKVKEKHEKDLKSKMSKAPSRNYAEGPFPFDDSCQFSHPAPAFPLRPPDAVWLARR